MTPQCTSVLKPLTLLFISDISLILSSTHLCPSLSPACTLAAATTSEPLQSLPLCLKQEMSPEVTSTSPSPNMAASNLAFVELQALQKPVSVSCGSGSSYGNSNHYPNAFNSFSHHAPVYGQFSSQSIMSGNAGLHLIHAHLCCATFS